MKERRAKPRYNAMFPCLFSASGPEDRTKGFIMNMNEQGVEIEASFAPRLGDEVEVSFWDHWGTEIRFDGIVVHSPSSNTRRTEEQSLTFGVQLSRIATGTTALGELISELGHRD